MPLARMFGHTNNKLLFQADDSFVLPNCFVGIEVELENLFAHMRTNRMLTAGMGERYALNVTPLNSWWDVHQDNSLRNGGIEFVSKKLFGRDLLNGIDEFYSFLNSLSKTDGVRIDASKRCSTHIHIDYRDAEISDIISAYCTYAIVERALFKYIAPNRMNSIYTIPLFRLNEFNSVLGELYTARDKNENTIIQTMGYFSEQQRYAAVNMHALVKYGSLEYRHANPIMDKKELITWINILLAIKQFSMGKYPEDVLKILHETQGLAFLQTVFGPYHQVFLNQDYMSLKADLVRGKRVARKIIAHAKLMDIHKKEMKVINQASNSVMFRPNETLTKFVQKNFKLLNLSSHGYSAFGLNAHSPIQVEYPSMTIWEWNSMCAAARMEFNVHPDNFGYKNFEHFYKAAYLNVIRKRNGMSFGEWLRSDGNINLANGPGKVSLHIAHIATLPTRQELINYGFINFEGTYDEWAHSEDEVQELNLINDEEDPE